MRRVLEVGALAEVLGELLSPTRCASCERPGALICDDCLDAMLWIDPVHACIRCGAPFGDALCTECDGGGVGRHDARPSIDRCLAAAVFDGPPSRIVRAYKDGGERRLSLELARIILLAAHEAERSAPDRYGGILTRADAVTFVPATGAAYRRRGFDHMEEIARPLARSVGIPLIDALVKHGDSDQRALGRDERLERSSSAYGVVEAVDGKRLLLLDDVITTGATMGAAASELKRAGAAHVDGLAFARVWA